MLDILKNKFDYINNGLYYKSGKRATTRAGTLRPDGYRQITVNIDGKQKTFLEHRLCFYYMTGRWPNEIDHINNIKDDNSWVNIRECDRSQNNRNKGLQKNNKYGCPGIVYYRPTNKYRAEIKLNGKNTSLGYYNTIEEAISARLIAEDKYSFRY